MPRTAEPGSLFYHPLDGALGSVAGVRVLRALSLHGDAVGAPTIARMARLTRAGTWNALRRLQAVGVVEPVGTGRSVPYRLKQSHPLAEVIVQLFAAEAERVDALFQRIRAVAAESKPTPRAIWLFGSAARGEDRPGSDLDLAVISEEEADARHQADHLAGELIEMVADWALSVSVISFSADELMELRSRRRNFWDSMVEDAVPIFGPPPEHVLG